MGVDGETVPLGFIENWPGEEKEEELVGFQRISPQPKNPGH